MFISKHTHKHTCKITGVLGELCITHYVGIARTACVSIIYKNYVTGGQKLTHVKHFWIVLLFIHFIDYEAVSLIIITYLAYVYVYIFYYV